MGLVLVKLQDLHKILWENWFWSFVNATLFANIKPTTLNGTLVFCSRSFELMSRYLAKSCVPKIQSTGHNLKKISVAFDRTKQWSIKYLPFIRSPNLGLIKKNTIHFAIES